MRKKYAGVDKELMRITAENLRSVLKRKGVSQKELADITGYSTSAISDYTNAKTLMSPGTVQALALALKVDKSDIDPTFRGTISKSPNTEIAVMELTDLAIEDLTNLELTYKGQKLTNEQKAHFIKLVRAAADMLGSS